MARIIKSCDYPTTVAMTVLKMINPGKIRIVRNSISGFGIEASVQPSELCYPEGWYYAKGCFRNKHTSTSGVYDEIVMVTPMGNLWGDIAHYSTL